jgi:acetyl-CoA carboxylase biotin carboxyl carrier protein
MAENAPGPAKPLDVQRLHYLVRLMKRYDLTALDVSDSSVQVRLRRSSPHVVPSHASAQPPLMAPSFPPTAGNPFSATPSRTESPSPVAAAAPLTVLIESPMVGTYYSSSAPDAPVFVSVGSPVQPSTIVCIIEAMKVFTDIPAGVSGTIAEILVKNGQAVEFGQPLFRVIPV